MGSFSIEVFVTYRSKGALDKKNGKVGGERAANAEDDESKGTTLEARALKVTSSW